MHSPQLVYLATAVVEGAIYLMARKHPSRVARGVRFYLLSALGIFAVLYPLSAHPGRVYFIAFIVSSYMTFAAELTVLHAILCELRGRDTALGSVRAWSIICLSLCLVTAGAAFLETPFAHDSLSKFWMGSMQIFIHVRMFAIFTLVLYSVLTAQWWSRAASLTWCGFTVYSLADSLTQRFEILTAYRFQSVLQYLPTAAGAFMFCLWAIAMVPQKQQAITEHDRAMIARLRHITRHRMAEEVNQ